jgi:hypothetical protein
MPDNYLTANITYAGLEDKGLTLQLLDSNKGKWTIWKKAYQSQDDSEAYLSLQGFKFGDSFGVSYLEKEESFTGKDGKLIKFKRKTIYSILPTIAEPTSTLPKQTAPVSNSEVKNDEFWQKKALSQCLWAYWLQMKVSGKELAPDWKEQVAEEFKNINEYADAEFTGGNIPF